MIPIIKGNESEAIKARTRGWIIGYFMDNLVANTKDLEVKLWRFDGPIDYGKKRFNGTELIIINEGRLRIEIEDSLGEKDTIIIDSANTEYIILPPYITKTIIVESSPARGVTVRWPSSPETL